MKSLFLIVSALFVLASCTNSVSNTGSSSGKTSPSQTGSPAGGSSSPKETRTVATPTYGSGKHTLEIFADFQCPACQNFSNTL